ncbi:MAG: diguanylate cyclase, partial [Planctomycetales bacterium]|nr:diguanylate cyclase [Planctomycetales bacterium]
MDLTAALQPDVTQSPPSELDGSSSELCTRIDALLAQCGEGSEDVERRVGLVHELAETLLETRAQLEARDGALAKMEARSESLVQAQAEALVRSAEIIDELEQTRQSLSDARRDAEAAASDTQRLAETIFERTHDAVLLIAEGACIACNDNAVQLLSTSRDKLLGEWPQVFETAQYDDGESAAGVLAAMCADANEEGSEALDVLLLRQPGGVFWAEIHTSRFLIRGSRRVLVVVRDVTEQKVLELELRRNRDFLDNIINAIPDQLVVKTPDRRIVVANDAFCRAHRVTREEVMAQPFAPLYDAAEVEHIDAIEQQILDTGECHVVEQEFVQTDGARIIAAVKRSVFKDATTGRRHIVAIGRDITDDRNREDRLRLLASVFNGASEGVAILSADGRIREANPAFLEMTTGGQNGAVGRRLGHVLNFGVADFQSVVKQVVQGACWSGKASIWRLRTGSRSYWVSLSPSTEEEGSSTRIVALVSDITELEDTQAKLRRQALYDNLTGLPNRRFYRDRLQSLIVDAAQNDFSLLIGFLDLDDFKHVNDSMGHNEGDLLLQEVGKRIRRVMGAAAFVSRFGGDEFAFILRAEGEVAAAASKVWEGLLAAFREPFQLKQSEASVGLSIGVTRFPGDGSDAETLMCNADIAMYAAKSAGKNSIRVFDRNMQANVD